MGRIKRYRTAISRHHRSKGHGIHSPFAFNFVRFVLREKSPYYCYEEFDFLRQLVVRSIKGVKKHPRVISVKDLKMIFRIANFFNPPCVMQVGSCYGLTASSVLNLSRSSRMWLYDPNIGNYPVVAQVLAPYLDRVECYNELNVAAGDYTAALNDGTSPFIIVNSIPRSEDLEPLKKMLGSMLASECVLVIRNIDRSDSVKNLWRFLKAEMVHGQSFTNEKTAVIVARKKLNCEHFFLWF